MPGSRALPIALLTVFALWLGSPAHAQPRAKPLPNLPVRKSGETPTPARGNPPADGDPTVAFINRYFNRTWEKEGLEHSAIVSDEEFIRRVSLDIIGRIASVEEIEQFLGEPAATRRSRLIDRLLAREEYVEHWSNLWTIWLLTRSGAREVGGSALQDWLGGQLRKNVPYKEVVERLLTATGKSSGNGEVNFILAHLGQPLPPADWAREGQFDMVPLTARITRLFLGIQTQCLQCHDHPTLPEQKQRHFWSVNAFLRQVERVGDPERTNEFELKDNAKLNREGLAFYELRSGDVRATPAVFLDGRPLAAAKARTRREALAGFVTSHELFAKAYVNRLWAHFFGRGLCVQPAADDFGPHNKVLHPELLERLARDFIDSNYDSKKLIKRLTSGKPYHLSASAHGANGQESAAPFFSRMTLKAMSPEQLHDSLQTATGAYGRFSLLLDSGDEEGNDPAYKSTVVQALFLMNGRQINDAIANRDWGRPSVALANNPAPRAVMNDLFLATLNRKPTELEYQTITAKLRMRLADKDPAAPWEDLLWALVNSNEFVLNH